MELEGVNQVRAIERALPQPWLPATGAGAWETLGIRHRLTIDLPSANGNSARAAQTSAAFGVNDLWTTVLRAVGGQGNFGQHTKGVIPGLWEPPG